LTDSDDIVTISLISRGFLAIKYAFISHIFAVDNDFFFTVLETTEIITLEIIVLH
jgi:hypothetical protein